MNRQFEEFCTLITEINSDITAIKLREASDVGLKGSHVMLLYELQKHPGGATGSELSAALSIDKAAISRSVRELDRMGMVRIGEQDGSIRYRAAITLTDEGRRAAAQLDEKIDRAVGAGAVSAFTPGEREFFYRALHQISAQLNGYRKMLEKRKKTK